jgi:hypothetical protein
MNELEKLKRENEELRANNNELRNNLRDACMYLACTVDITKFNSVLNKTQVHSLADVKADAIDSALDNCAWYHNREFIKCDDIIKYANKLRNK